MRRNHVRISDHFHAYEIECPCCGRLVLRPELLKVGEIVRVQYAHPFTPTSGCRCLLHNADIYDRKNRDRVAKGLPRIKTNKSSPHLIGSAPQIIDKGGWAWDVPITYNMADLDDTEKWFQDIGVIGVGFAQGFTHIDVKPRSGTKFRSWIYNSGKAIRRTVVPE